MISAGILLLAFATVSVCDIYEVKLGHDLPDNVQCIGDKQCPPGYCCSTSTLGENFTVCSSLGDEGQTCKQGEPRTTSKTYTYPNNKTITLDNVFISICPCRSGLVCGNDGLCTSQIL